MKENATLVYTRFVHTNTHVRGNLQLQTHTHTHNSPVDNIETACSRTYKPDFNSNQPLFLLVNKIFVYNIYTHVHTKYSPLLVHRHHENMNFRNKNGRQCITCVIVNVRMPCQAYKHKCVVTACRSGFLSYTRRIVYLNKKKKS